MMVPPQIVTDIHSEEFILRWEYDPQQYCQELWVTVQSYDHA